VWRGLWGLEEAEGKELTPDADLLVQSDMRAGKLGTAADKAVSLTLLGVEV
jgi:hypothetical protein